MCPNFQARVAQGFSDAQRFDITYYTASSEAAQIQSKHFERCIKLQSSARWRWREGGGLTRRPNRSERPRKTGQVVQGCLCKVAASSMSPGGQGMDQENPPEEGSSSHRVCLREPTVDRMQQSTNPYNGKMPRNTPPDPSQTRPDYWPPSKCPDSMCAGSLMCCFSNISASQMFNTKSQIILVVTVGLSDCVKRP